MQGKNQENKVFINKACLVPVLNTVLCSQNKENKETTYLPKSFFFFAIK